MPRFVILEHDHPVLHWDLMLEVGEKLRTWRLEALPGPGQTVAAEAIGDHRIIYLDYEGPLSGNRGEVKRWDAGTFSWQENSEEHVVVSLSGNRVRGVARLVRSPAGKWTLTMD